MMYKNIIINVNDIINGDGCLRSRFEEALRRARLHRKVNNVDPLAMRAQMPLRTRKGGTLFTAYLRRMRRYRLPK